MYALACRRMADGVRQQIADDPSHHQGIAPGGCGLAVEAQGYPALLCPGFEEVEDLQGLLAEIEREAV